MKHWEQNQYYNKDLEERKIWYSPVAEAYNKTIPNYPQELIKRVLKLAQLSSQAKILEIGCGSGKATVAFAELGFSLVCVEPNPDFCQLAKKNCASYPNVEIQNISFEDWQPKFENFDAVLAATSIHWIPAEIAYSKAASTLKENGFLILLWNIPLEPDGKAKQILDEVYQIHAPSFSWYKDRKNHEEDLQSIGEIILNWGNFQDLVYEQIIWEVNYSSDDYVKLLSTFSSYMELEASIRKNLFVGLREKIEENFAGNIKLLNLSAFHIARKQG
jgi:SAM-dependent methyltransferase